MTIEEAEAAVRAEILGLTDYEYRQLAYLKMIVEKLDTAFSRLGW
jgi:hypothetical protein